MAHIRASFYRPNEYATDNYAPVATIDDILSWQVTMTQANRFDGHSLEMATTHRAVLFSLVPFSTVDIEQIGVGVIGRGLVIAPEQQVRNTGVGTIVLDLPNITDQGLDVSTGMGYIDAQAISGVVANLGALTTKGESFLQGYTPQGLAVTTFVPGKATGWSAAYLDDGTTLNSSAPVTWGTLVRATALGNSVTRDPGGLGGYDGAGASGLPIHTDVAQFCSVQWQVVIPSIERAGLRTDASVGMPDWGFDFSAPVTAADGTKSGTWTIIAARTLTAITGTYPSNSNFTVALNHPGGVPQMQYSVNGLLVYSSGVAPVAPFVPVAEIAMPGGTAGGAIDNAIMARTAPASQAWYQVQYNKLSQPGALIQLASDTGMWVRQAADANGTPLRAYELGPMNAPATVTLRDGRGGTLEKLRANPRLRVVDEITSYKSDSSGVYTVTTPLGAGTGPAQVTLELLWRILYDPLFQDFSTKYPSLAAIFPEYDPLFGIHRTPTLAAGYEYYLRYEPAMNPGGLGAKEGGPAANSQIAYPAQATVAQQEATQRVLYKAAVELMKRAIVPHVTLTLTTIGDGRPPKAGDKVHIDYTRTGNDALGPWTPTRIFTGGAPGAYNGGDLLNPDPRVLSVVRAASGDAQPMDTWTISNLGRYEESPASRAAGQQQQVAALQITTQTGTSASLGNPAFTEIDAAHPVILPFYIPPTTYKVLAFYLILGFWPFRQTTTQTSALVENAKGTPVVSVGGVDILLPTPADLGFDTVTADGGFAADLRLHVYGASGGIGSSVGAGFQPGPQANVLAVSGNSVDVTGIWTPGRTTGTSLRTDDTSHGHGVAATVATKGETVAHIPAGTPLAELPQHFHPAPADIAEEATPSGIAVEIDSGDGVFVERTAQLIDIRSNQPGTANGFTGNCVLEISRFTDFPGRFVNVRLSSMPNATNGRGRVSWNSTVLLSLGGPGAIVTASQ